MQAKTIRVIVIDDSAMIPTILAGILNKSPNVAVVATACDTF